MIGEPDEREMDAVPWRRQVTALFIAQLAVVFGVSFVFPFLPLFLQRDLDVRDSRALALWVGVASAMVGVGIAIGSPVWGAVADRFGRKAMLLRAMFSGAVALTLMGAVQTPLELTLARLFFGLIAGTQAIFSTVVSEGTPRKHVGTAMGAMSAAIAIGTSTGPFFGGLGAAAFGIRSSFFAGGLVQIIAAIPVLLFVRDTRPARAAVKQRFVTELRAVPGTLTALVKLASAQLLVNVVTSGIQPMVALRILQLAPQDPSTSTGAAFGLLGAATAFSALAHTRLRGRLGFRKLGTIAAVAAALGAAKLALSDELASLFIGVAIAGAAGGALLPIVFTMVGLESPSRVRATVFGLNQSALASGIAIGPAMAGLIAATASVSVAFAWLGFVALAVALLFLFAIREPRP